VAADGIELIDLSGPVAVGADARGTLNDPQIRGSLRTERARLESPVTGTVIENVVAGGRFGGSQLVIDRFTGTTKRDGAVSGRGTFDFSAARGFGMDLAVDTRAAQLIDRDDLKAQVSGPLRIRTGAGGGIISGDLSLVSGSFKLGSATAAAQVPRLPIRELNRAEEDLPAPRRAEPWRLQLGLKADDRLIVTGLGINSEWGSDLSIGGTVTEPRITGRADLVRGSYDFAGRRFDLERGTIRFAGESPPNPILDIVAEGGIQGLNAVIRVTGRGQKPEIAFTEHARSAAGRAAQPPPVRHVDHQPVRAGSAAAGRGGGVAEQYGERARPDQQRAIRGRPGSPAHPAGGHRDWPGDLDRGRQVSEPEGLCGGGDRRARLFRNAHRISDHRWLSLLSSISTAGRRV
jgi:hypothetical protein